MMDVRHVSTTVARPWPEVYEAIWRPERFPAWASGLSRADLRRDGDAWIATGSEGTIRIVFTGHNPFGVMDHTVHLALDRDVHVPMRVVANGAGAEVTLTLFRQPDMSDEVFARDIAWVTRDLAALKRLVEGEALGRGQPGDKPDGTPHGGGE